MKIKMSLPNSWLSDIVDRGICDSQVHAVWDKIDQGYSDKKPGGSLRLMLDESDLREIIEDAYFYSVGHYDSDIERPYKYILPRAKAKLAELKNLEGQL